MAAIEQGAHLLDEEDDMVAVEEVSPEEGLEILNRQARRRLGISGTEFLRKWDAGEFRNGKENIDAIGVSLLIPFARPAGSSDS